MSSSTNGQELRDSPLPNLTASNADLLPFGILVADAAGSAIYANRVWTSLTGQDKDQWRDGGWFDIVDTDRRDSERAALIGAVQSGRSHEVDWTISLSRSGQRVLHVTAMAELVDGGLTKMIVSIADVTDVRMEVARLGYEATHDPLTGLFNRSQFLEFVEHALDRQARTPESLAAVLFIDVDGLKGTNDRYGHEAGDRLLRAVSSRILAAVRPADIVARYGGDEFVVLCQDLSDSDHANVIAERIADSARGPGVAEHTCSLSIGVTMVRPSIDPVEIVYEADRDMYRSRSR